MEYVSSDLLRYLYCVRAPFIASLSPAMSGSTTNLPLSLLLVSYQQSFLSALPVHWLRVPLSPQPALHPVFEALGYACNYALYRQIRRRSGDFLDEDQRWLVIAAAAIGALLGSRILGLLGQAPRLYLTLSSLLSPGGKTIVGGLLGGWIAVEVIKRIKGVRTRTGDLFVSPPTCLSLSCTFNFIPCAAIP